MSASYTRFHFLCPKFPLWICLVGMLLEPCGFPWMAWCFPTLRLARRITICWPFNILIASIDICNKYVGICAASSTSFSSLELGCLRDVQLEVEFKPEARPIFCKPRSVPFAMQEELAQAYNQVRLGLKSREGSRWALIAEFYFRAYFLSESVPPLATSSNWPNGRNYQWSSRCSRLPGRHSLQWCNSGSTFTESAPVTRKASWQRTALPAWEMYLCPATSGLLGARAVQWRNSLRSKGQCPQRDASAAWRVHTTFVSGLLAILCQVFATKFCFSGRTATLSYQERSSVSMGVRRGSSFSSAEGALIYSRCARSFWSIPSIRSRLRCISSRDWRDLVSPLFWRKWTTNSQHFQNAHSKSAQLQSDTKRSVGHHLCLEEILPIFIWKKVHFSDRPSAFSGRVSWLRLLLQAVYLNWALFLRQFSYTIEYRKTSDHSNADVLSRLPVGEDPNFDKDESTDDVDTVCIIKTLSLQVRPTDSGTLRKESSRDPTLTKVMRFTREGWPEKKDSNDPAEKFRKIADSVFVMVVYCMEPEWWFRPSYVGKCSIFCTNAISASNGLNRWQGQPFTDRTSIPTFSINVRFALGISPNRRKLPSTLGCYLRSPGAASILIMPSTFWGLTGFRLLTSILSIPASIQRGQYQRSHRSNSCKKISHISVFPMQL